MKSASFRGQPARLHPGLAIRYTPQEHRRQEMRPILRIDTLKAVDYQQHGGILPHVLSELLAPQ